MIAPKRLKLRIAAPLKLRRLASVIAVCWGAGWDSTAMLIEMVKRGIRPAIITFADTGAEKQGTYDFIPVFTQYLLDHGFPKPIICDYKGLGAECAERYMKAARQTVARLGLSLSPARVDRLGRLYGNMVANHTMPSITFGKKGCSVKWKLTAQEYQ